MFNSCTFNSVKYNSKCVLPEIIEPITGHRRRFRRLFKKEFFEIVGTKLIFHEQIFDIIGFLLLNTQSNFELKGQSLEKIFQDLLLKGKTQHYFKTQQEISGIVKFYEENYLGIKYRPVRDIIFINELHSLYGKKLWLSNQFNTLKCLKQIPFEQGNLIKGRKDITEILEILDLVDE